MLTAAKPPLVYLITDGELTTKNFDQKALQTLNLICAAVAARVPLVQIREKQINARQLFELTWRAREITKNSVTQLLINDRADVALAARADGVHLTANSLPAIIIRRDFPGNFIIGVSCHSLAEVWRAKSGNANFATFSPIFATKSKMQYGAPQGIEKLRRVCQAHEDFPIIALGGIDQTNFRQTLTAGASGVAAIKFFNQPDKLSEIVRLIRDE